MQVLEMLAALAITEDDIKALGRGFEPTHADWEYLDLLDDAAKSMFSFYWSGQGIPRYKPLSDLKPNERCTVVALVEKDPRLSQYTTKTGDAGKFASIWIRDMSGTRELMLWDKDEVALAEVGGIKQGSVLMLLGARLAEGKQGLNLSLGTPHVIKIDPPGIQAKYFDPQGQSGTTDIAALSDIDSSMGLIVNIKGILTEKGKFTTFKRKSGGQGTVVHVRLFDSTATANVTLWDDAAAAVEFKEIGSETILTSLRVKMDTAGLTLHSTNATKVL